MCTWSLWCGRTRLKGGREVVVDKVICIDWGLTFTLCVYGGVGQYDCDHNDDLTAICGLQGRDCYTSRFLLTDYIGLIMQYCCGYCKLEYLWGYSAATSCTVAPVTVATEYHQRTATCSSHRVHHTCSSHPLPQGLDFVPSRENHIWFSPDSFARINWFSFYDKIHNTAQSNCYAN